MDDNIFIHVQCKWLAMPRSLAKSVCNYHSSAQDELSGGWVPGFYLGQNLVGTGERTGGPKQLVEQELCVFNLSCTCKTSCLINFVGGGHTPFWVLCRQTPRFRILQGVGLALLVLLLAYSHNNEYLWTCMLLPELEKGRQRFRSSSKQSASNPALQKISLASV